MPSSVKLMLVVLSSIFAGQWDTYVVAIAVRKDKVGAVFRQADVGRIVVDVRQWDTYVVAVAVGQYQIRAILRQADVGRVVVNTC